MNDSEATKMEPLWFDQWTSTVNTCFDGLEPNDLRQVQSHGSWDDVQEQLKKGSSDRPTTMNFASVKTGLPRFRTFVEDWLQKVSTDLDRSVPWGLTRLIIKLLQEETAAIPHILPMLCNTYKELGKFNSYFNEFETFTPELKEHCVEASVILVGFLTAIVKFMRNDMPLDGRPSSGITWQPLDTTYLSTISKMDQLLASLKDLSKQAHRPNRPKRNSSDKQEWSISQPLLTDEPPRYHLLDDDAKLPYVGLPSSTRTSRFFDRDNVIGIIEKHFDSSPPSSSFLSITLHGLGGVGKSTVALKYAEKKLKHEELDALLWVHSEKLVTISQSFTDIAMRLKLPDARQGDHEENRALVLNWLQKTRCRWLIVYDNAEDPNLIRPYWPVASRCRAIITTRNPSFKFELTGAGFEVREWDKEAGHKFLLHLLKTDIRSCLDETEVTSALELSEKLSGHALAIATMAGVIHDRAMSIKEFMEFYNQDPGEVLGSFGNKFMTALWKASFKTLDPNSQALLGVMSFLEPDSIPEIMFSPPSPSDLPSSLSFCCNFLPFSDATGNLLKRALIKRDSKSRTLSLHRMVQTASKYFMTPQQRQQAFNDATIVVSKAFPRRDSTVAQMYLMWEKCALYLRHVISLKDCFREEKKSNPDFVPLQTYCDLNNACQRYLLELNSYEELEGLIEVNTLALESLPKEQQLVGLWGSLTSHKGQLLCRLGRVEEGVEWLKQSYDIRSRDVPFRPQESAWAADNAATGIATSNNFEEAIIWYNRARDHYLEWSNQQPERKGQWPAAIMRSMGMGLIWSGRREEAKKLLQGALEQVESTKPYNWAVAAGTHFGLGTVDRFDGRYDEAEMHFMEAQNSWLKGDQMRSDPFNGACMYRLGCVALDQGLVEAAVKHLRDALVITEKRKDILIAEHARCLFKLSEALEQDSKSENEARSTRDEAERLLKQRGPDDLDPGKEISYDSLVYMSWR